MKGKFYMNIDLNMKWNDYPSDTIYLWNGNTIFRIAEGTGDNLLEEDEAAGYKDYWMTEYMSRENGNGGMWLETELISDMNYTIQGVIDRLMDCDLWEDDWKIINEDLGDELLDVMNKYWFAKGEMKRLVEEANGRG